MKKGKLYLIPNTIADDKHFKVIPLMVTDTLTSIHHFLAEDVRTARRYLSSLKIYDQIETLNFNVLDKNSSADEMDRLMDPIHQGYHIGVISESGCPGIADPGAMAVAYAHKHHIQVIPLVGPSSILLALMASGLNGQQFAFHGYLPVDKDQLKHAIESLERESKKKKQTQIVIETPYRNNTVFSAFIKVLQPATHLCVGVDITGKNEHIQTLTVADWKKVKAEWPKSPAVFLFLAS